MDIWDGSSKTRSNLGDYRSPDGADWQRMIKEVQKIQVEINKGDIYTNMSDDFIYIGQPIVLNANNYLKRAKKSNPEVIGISLVKVLPTTNTIYITSGRLQLEDWTNVTGTINLIPGSFYYLSMSSFGLMTHIPPDSFGDSIVEIGRAQNRKLLSINLKTPLYL